MVGTQLTVEERIKEKITPEASRELIIHTPRGMLAFSNADQVMTYAKMMSVSKVGVPTFLRNDPGACLSVIMQALDWGFNPFSVAAKAYVVGDKIAYESQLIQAVILRHAPIVGRIQFEFTGEAEDRICKASAVLNDGSGEFVEYTSPPVKKITPKNSPLWKTDPDQQQSYYAGRALCRRHFPDVLLGAYSVDELEDTPRNQPQRVLGPQDALSEDSPDDTQEDPALAGDFVAAPPPTRGAESLADAERQMFYDD